ncbi:MULTISPECIES: aminotransferase class V-fold PLP-dependent enzyme [unclassified Halomonas]|uniref:aminotransferase class V-fold PLP-dependent enzyme n=1 Tax=unclassified Halomonas TaxID=2609666 RepID=UPI0028863F58|nr:MULTISPECIES: aminotransferase class V-fold PLP-dependent enzyme [unclassified Halomonas]MDT0501406.1 aminotransferase class V-fold PLP-dependent enzyme [Halomonas sp. PAR7]MDT0512920.1 aminotransferase class V-fold PLP-dependent enzyme [Halomonas sp. LES1]MDT0591255.1 aminotransferase class V-fold PLP-dependent enzyme [Halomonas sp. PAR8]
MSHPVSPWSTSSAPTPSPSPRASEWVARIRHDIIGEGRAIPGPFGPRPLVYTDYTASGRALHMIERAIQEKVLPNYGNTHTETSYTGMRTTRLREAARQAVREGVGAGPEHAVIFAGAGATAAIDRFSRILDLPGLHRPAEAARPVIFIGPFEHHSNDLAWREADADLVRIPLDADGLPDLVELERALQAHAERPLKVAAFSAASNVTGVLTDVRQLAALVHRHGGILACDYAAAGPYVPIDMAESAPGANDHLDAIFLSPHKFIGGPGTSGVLVIDRALCRNAVPGVAGGGTVSYVTEGEHHYVTDPERREEGGTPGIVENIRTGLVFTLKQQVGAHHIAELETALTRQAMERWSRLDNLHILGPRHTPRLGIVSFNISAGSRLLHHNLVVALLNDLFGIQARGGCSCAGPYAHSLLDISETQAQQHAELVHKGKSLFRPGWVRLGFNYFFNSETACYIIDAVEFIARHAAVLMRLYRVDVQSGTWRARQAQAPCETPSLSALLSPDAPHPEPTPPDFEQCFAQAQALVDSARTSAIEPPSSSCADEEALRWFWWPHESSEAASALDEMTP